MDDLKSQINICENISNMIQRAGLVKDGANLAEMLKFELFKFTIYLNRNQKMSNKQIAFINYNLGYNYNQQSIDNYRFKYTTTSFIPNSLKYFILGDLGTSLMDSMFGNTKHHILYRLYETFGTMFISIEKNDESNKLFETFLNALNTFIATNGLQPIVPVKENLDVNTTIEEKVTISLEDSLKKLDSLTGLKEVKEDVNNLVNLIKVQKMREEKGLKQSNISKHMVFSGNPGTGKTTVARLIGDIYKSLGVLSKGQLIEVDRSNLVAGYVGQTAIKVQEVVKEALGGILFIDEAYSLTVGKGDDDFGKEAVDTLLKAMEDNRDDLVLIVAGYPDLMNQFLESNPGLESRFNKHIFFSDYTETELKSIFLNMCKEQDYLLSEDSDVWVNKFLQDICKFKPKNFANARDMRNLLEYAIARHATRIVNLEEINKEILSTLETSDLEGFKI